MAFDINMDNAYQHGLRHQMTFIGDINHGDQYSFL